jgi:hypothetical protein
MLFAYLIIPYLIITKNRVRMTMRMKTWIMLLHYPYQRKIKGRERPLVCITLPHFCMFLAISNLEANKVHKKFLLYCVVLLLASLNLRVNFRSAKLLSLRPRLDPWN